MKGKLIIKDEIAKPIEQKLEIARGVIEQHFQEFQPEECFVAWSGGKDSTLMLYLIRQVYPQVLVVFNDTGVEHPETLDFVDELSRLWGLNLTILHPAMSFWQCVERYGFPPPSRFKTGDKKTGTPRCCFHLKEKPVIQFIKEMQMKASFIGVTAWESWGRRITAGKLGYCHFSKVYGLCRVKPILCFRPDEIWFLTKEWQLPVNAIYQKAERCGCMPCTGHIGWEKQIARINPKLYMLIQKKMGTSEFQLPLR